MLLHQITAKLNVVKPNAHRAITDMHHGKGAMNHDKIAGIEKTYAPRDDDGENLPGEEKIVETMVADVLERVRWKYEEFIDLQALQDRGNQLAKADVVVDDVVVLRDVPVTHLLWLAKQLQDLRSMLLGLPILDPKQRWTWDPNRHAWAAEPKKTTRSKKVPRNHVKAEATDKHPAQVEVYYEDTVVGEWTTVQLSGAVPAAEARVWVDRVDELIAAVRVAREAANNIDVPELETSYGRALFAHIFR